MADIQSATAEIRRGKEKRKKIEITGQNITSDALLHMATIKTGSAVSEMGNRLATIIGMARKWSWVPT